VDQRLTVEVDTRSDFTKSGHRNLL
jgi:hypothetical protein